MRCEVRKREVSGAYLQVSGRRTRAGTAKAWLLSGPSPVATNLAAPAAIAIRDETVTLRDDAYAFEMPPCSVAAVEVGSALYDVGARFDAVSDRIAARTNTLGDQMDQLNSTLRESFRGSASSLEEVGNVLTGVTQSLHLTGQAAVDVTGQIDDLNRKTGDSLNIRGLGQALAAFGVDSHPADCNGNAGRAVCNGRLRAGGRAACGIDVGR